MTRTAAREFIMQNIFQMEAQNTYTEESYQHFIELNTDEPLDTQEQFIEDVCKAFIERKTEVDELIEKYSKGWKISRLAKVDLAVLRMCITESYFLSEDKKTPVGAAINEAVKIVKKYGSEDSGKFVNGILGEISRR